jgi:hypothetical protein
MNVMQDGHGTHVSLLETIFFLSNSGPDLFVECRTFVHQRTLFAGVVFRCRVSMCRLYSGYMHK